MDRGELSLSRSKIELDPDMTRGGKQLAIVFTDRSFIVTL